MKFIKWGAIAAPLRQSMHYLRDPQVPWWIKLIPILLVVYVISPIDVVPDVLLGLGQLDDVAIILIGLKLFLSLAPRMSMNYQTATQGRTEKVNMKQDAQVIEEGEFEEV